MQCEFCREAMDDAAVVCPHCRREPARVREARAAGRWSLAVKLIGGAMALFVGLLILGSLVTPDDPGERIKRVCAREYVGESERAECEVRLVTQTLINAESDRLRRTADAAGVR